MRGILVLPAAALALMVAIAPVGAGQPAGAASADALWAAATRDYERDRYDAAAAAFARLTEQTPEDGTAWAMRALCEYRLAQPDAALAHLEKARALGVRGDAQFRNVLRYHEGVLRAGKGEFERAQETLTALVAESDSDESLFALGLAVLRVLPAELEQASPDLPRAVRHAGIAERHAARKEHDAALRAYQALSLAYPHVRNTAYALARHFVARREPGPAADAYRTEIARFPDHVPARLGLAAATSTTDPTSALRHAEEAVRLNPRVPLGHYLLGSLLLTAGETTRAIAELELAEQSVKSDPRVYYALSRAYARAGRTSDAERARSTFLRITDEQQRAARTAQ